MPEVIPEEDLAEIKSLKQCIVCSRWLTNECFVYVRMYEIKREICLECRETIFKDSRKMGWKLKRELNG